MNKTRDLQFATDLRTVLTRLVKKLRAESVTGQQLSLTERSSMALLLQHKTLLPSELADMEKITNQSMSQVVSHLFELGYITRTPSLTDKRKVNISLSEEGERILLQVRHERDEWLARAIDENCSPGEQEKLREAVKLLTRLVDFE